ncbi:hypothetical protein Zm00014a_011853 [Zea mays]|uniref:Phytosulfokine n=1 Tax=Zea mays TaxID=4577 RepID=A0A3L6FLT0_MAIZE|nr:hypothetical protein Zm00014a_011853 [Zea mays]
MRRRSGSMPLPLAAAALLLLLVCFFHCSAAARLLPPSPVPAQLVHRETGVGGLALQEGGVGNGDELSISGDEMMAAEVEEGAVACEADDDEDDGCMQRRLLQNAHLDYIYTQHKGKP